MDYIRLLICLIYTPYQIQLVPAKVKGFEAFRLPLTESLDLVACLSWCYHGSLPRLFEVFELLASGPIFPALLVKLMISVAEMMRSVVDDY